MLHESSERSLGCRVVGVGDPAAGKHPQQSSLRSTLGRRVLHHLIWKPWSIPQRRVGLVVYGQRQM